MKTKTLFLAAATAMLTLQAAAQHRADQQKLDNPESFSMILMGDPQSYIKYDINQPLFELTTAWTADNIDNLRIKAVLVTGDLVEMNENLIPPRHMTNQTSRQMWESVSRAFQRLDNKVPYIISQETTTTATAVPKTEERIFRITSPWSATTSGTTCL